MIHRRLHHRIPAWVSDTAVFHIRIRCAVQNPVPLTDPSLAGALLESIADCARRGLWSCYLALLMPDHLHGLFIFGRSSGMSRAVGDWKRARFRFQGVAWQEGYFDHRIRNAAEFSEKYAYIERNPVASKLCAHPEDWAWRTSAFVPESVPSPLSWK